jgi:hypothetical protein
VVAIASVIGQKAEIEAAWLGWATGAGTGATTYTCWVVTGRAVGHVSVAYDRELYDERTDRENSLTPTSMASWVRPLAGIIGLRWDAFYEDSSHDDTYYPAQPITVRFTDSFEITIPEEANSVPPEQRPTVEDLLKALRKGAKI